MSSQLSPFQEYIKSLNESAEVEIDLSKPLKLYLRSTELVFKQAAVYIGEGDLERSYILFMKFCNLVLDKLPRHPEYSRTEFSSQKTRLKDLCRKSISKLEDIRPRLQESFEEALKTKRLAEKELANIAKSENSTLQSDLDRLQQMKNETESMLSRKETYNSNTSEFGANCLSSDSSEPSAYNLPPALIPTSNTIPPSLLSDIDANSTLKAMHSRAGLSEFNVSSENSRLNGSIHQLSAPKFFSENGEALRPVHIPEKLISDFLNLASQNTKNNLETCGVLAGKLNHNEFTITCLIIPKQVATSDTCAMINEEEIIIAQDSLDVMSLGWIHTHPTQKCFLSSVDLHTHMPFQLLMAEAIAVVCAPTQTPNFGVFRLTDPPGLEIITKCQHPSAFHPHPENKIIYKELKGPNSHAQLKPGLPLEVIDLRK